MRKDILESVIEFKDGKIERVTVLLDCTSSDSKPLTDVRAIIATSNPRSGYMFLSPSSEVCEKLLEDVADMGLEISSKHRDSLFQNWKNKHLARVNQNIKK